MTRVRALVLLAVGCALAAAAASTGAFLEADRRVAPFRIRRAPEPIRTRRPRAGQTDRGTLSYLAEAVDVVFQALVIGVAVAAVVWGLYRVGLALLRLYRLRAGRTRSYEAAPYDPGEQSEEDAETALRRRVAEELRMLSADLDDYVEPREAVIACYVRMEAALAGAGARRDVTETPLELLRRVLASYDVPAADVRRLTTLFTEARFSHHPVTDEMRAAARRSLASVADALAVRA